MPTLRISYAIYTTGASPRDSLRVPRGLTATLDEMPRLMLPAASDDLFGPHAETFLRAKPTRGFVLSFSQDVRGHSAPFFEAAREVLLQAVEGIDGWGLDVLRLWPFPLAQAETALAEELLAEDIFSVGFTSMGEHGYRAESVGLAKLGQRELSFEFTGVELLEEAALLVAHLTDWVLEHGRRIDAGASMTFGFDKLRFVGPSDDVEGEAAFRGWHPPLVQRLLPPEVFPGVGVLDVAVQGDTPDASLPLTSALMRALEQRLLLEELDLTGDSPHHGTLAEVRGHILNLNGVVAWREEPAASKDSGWRLQLEGSTAAELGKMTLGDLAHKVPELIRYLALPPGVRLTWDSDARLTVDASRAQHIDEDADGAPTDESDDDLRGVE